MPIDKLVVSNFKGIAEKTEFEIKPITLFIGPNSSGKSSCIHALAALAQTVKLSSSKIPIVLDDEYAQVHLGRFIEVIHSGSYSDAMEIGISLNKSEVSIRYGKERQIITKDDEVHALFSYKSTKRTQDIFIDKCELSVADRNLVFRKSKTEYTIRYNSKPLSIKANHLAGLKLSFPPVSTSEVQSELFDAFLLNESISDIISTEIRKISYLGPFRQPPQRRYPTRGSAPQEVGSQGESTVTLLANEYMQSKTKSHIKEVSQWMGDLGLAQKVDVARVGKSDLFDVQVTLNDGIALPIADLGYGISQILPVLAQCSFAKKGSVLLFEQPELHLHHAAARKLATVFVKVAKQKNLRIVAETHSEDLFLQILCELNNKNLNPDDLAAYEVCREDGKSKFKKIDILEADGRFECESPWNRGIKN